MFSTSFYFGDNHETIICKNGSTSYYINPNENEIVIGLPIISKLINKIMEMIVISSSKQIYRKLKS